VIFTSGTPYAANPTIRQIQDRSACYSVHRGKMMMHEGNAESLRSALRLAAETPYLRYRVEALVRIDPSYAEAAYAELAELLQRVAEAPFVE